MFIFKSEKKSDSSYAILHKKNKQNMHESNKY